jgi:hypothetical protein
MLTSLYLEPRKFINAAKVVHHRVLSKRQASEPVKDLRYALIQSAILPATVDFYMQVTPQSKTTQMFKKLSLRDISNLQLKLLFSNMAASTYQRYCQIHKIFMNEGLEHENQDAQKLLIQTVGQHLKSALTINQSVSETVFTDVVNQLLEENSSSFITKQKLKAFVYYLKYIGDMLYKTGLHRTDFIELNESVIDKVIQSKNGSEFRGLFKRTAAKANEHHSMVSKKSTIDVLLAYRALENVHRPDFTIVDKSTIPTPITDPGDEVWAEFNPAAKQGETQ